MDALVTPNDGYGVVSLHAIKGLLWESEVMRVDRSDPDNKFSCDTGRLNLTGDSVV